MTSTIQQIREHAQKYRAGTPLTAKGLLHLGSRAAVDQALSRLARCGELRRISRGLYVRSIETRFGSRLPEASVVLRELAKQTGEAFFPSGALVAYNRGLTSQVPVRQVYLTSGRSRMLFLGAQTIELRHTKQGHLGSAAKWTNDAIRLLQWARPGQETDRVIELLTETGSNKEMQDLLSLRPHLSTPKAVRLSELAHRA